MQPTDLRISGLLPEPHFFWPNLLMGTYPFSTQRYQIYIELFPPDWSHWKDIVLSPLVMLQQAPSFLKLPKIDARGHKSNTPMLPQRQKAALNVCQRLSMRESFLNRCGLVSSFLISARFLNACEFGIISKTTMRDRLKLWEHEEQIYIQQSLSLSHSTFGSSIWVP